MLKGYCTPDYQANFVTFQSICPKNYNTLVTSNICFFKGNILRKQTTALTNNCSYFTTKVCTENKTDFWSPLEITLKIINERIIQDINQTELFSALLQIFSVIFIAMIEQRKLENIQKHLARSCFPPPRDELPIPCTF